MFFPESERASAAGRSRPSRSLPALAGPTRLADPVRVQSDSAKHNLCLCCQWAVYRLYTGTPAIAGHENVLCHESLGMTRGKKVHFQSDPRGNRKGHGRLPRPGLCQWPQAGDSAQPANQGWTFFHPWGAGAQWGGPGAFLRTRTIRNQGGRPVAPKTRPG